MIRACLVLVFCSGALQEAVAQNCTKGKPCGNTCIPRANTCRVGSGTARWAPGADTVTGIVRHGRVAARPAVDTSGKRVFNDFPPARRATCVVQSITDGDTFRCRAQANSVRLLLIDAPERGQGSFGRRATARLRALMKPGDDVVLELDIQERDRYGRTLAYVYRSDGVMVNEEMARSGLVLVSIYPPNVKHVERIRTAADDAKKARRGLWSTSAFECSPADYRARRC